MFLTLVFLPQPVLLTGLGDLKRGRAENGRIDGLMQQRRNSSANALELRLFYTLNHRYTRQLFMHLSRS